MKKGLKRTAWLLSVGMLLVLSWCGYQYISIGKVGEAAKPQKADALIVLGAGVWENGPSPSLLARTLHAADLYQQGYAQHIIVSGGLGKYPPTEAEVMQQLLLEQGVPEDAIILEPLAKNTYQNLKFSKQLMDERGWSSAVIVTDVFHIKRSLAMADKLGITASGSGAKESVLYKNKDRLLTYTLREVLAMGKFYVLGD